MRIRNLIAAAFVCMTASPLLAQDRYVCKVTSVSKQGFSSLEAARTWFPESVGYAIQGNEALSTYYGVGRASKRGAVVQMVFADGGHRLIVTINTKSGRHRLKLEAFAGRSTLPGARGTCSPA